MRRHKGKAAALAAIGSLTLALGTVSATQASAAAPERPPLQAPTCNGWVHNANGPGGGGVEKAGNMKAGPYSVCGNVKYLSRGTYVYYWCYAVNGYGNTWTYARIKGTTTQGWVSDDALPLNPGGATRGSTTSCNGTAAPKLPAELMNAK